MRPFFLIDSVMIGAGSPFDIPVLIAVVSAIFLATLPGGIVCLALAASSNTGTISGSIVNSSVPNLDFIFVSAAKSICNCLASSVSLTASSRSSILFNASFNVSNTPIIGLGGITDSSSIAQRISESIGHSNGHNQKIRINCV